MKPEMIAKYAHLGKRLWLPWEIIVQIEKVGTTPTIPVIKDNLTTELHREEEGRFTIDDIDKLNLEQAKEVIRKLMKKLEKEKMKPETNWELEQAKSLEDVLIQNQGITI